MASGSGVAISPPGADPLSTLRDFQNEPKFEMSGSVEIPSEPITSV
jgi:hypothetical protein